MKHYAGLDVSVKETSVCVIDEAGATIREAKVASEPEALVAVLMDDALTIERIGLEAGPLSQWLYSGLARPIRIIYGAAQQERPQRCPRHCDNAAFICRVSTQITGKPTSVYRPVHIKTLASQKRRMLLTSRQLLQAKALDIENGLRGTLRNFGLKVGVVGTAKFEARIRELVADHADLAAISEPLLIARRVLRAQLGVLHRRLLAVVRHDQACRRLMTVPGVGPVVALTFRATVDVPARFRNSKAVGAAFGMTPRRHQSGELDRMGNISKCGDAMTRTTLFGAAQVMLTRTIRWSWLKAWGLKIARHRGMKRAIVAVARRMAVIMHRMWADGTEFRWTSSTAAAV
jgi:transposase